MAQQRVGVFGGIAGRVLTGALGIGTALTAVILGVAGGLLIAFSFASGAEWIASLGLPALAAVALARLALNAREGDWSGSVLSTAGGGWGDVGRVLGGFLALGVCWSIPLAVIGAMSGGETAEAAPGPGMMLPGLPQPPVLLMVYAMSGLFLQPAALIVATGARSFADNFSMEHWSELFTGRVGDLLLLCTLNVGGPALFYLLLFPVVLGALFTQPSAAFVGLAIGGALVTSFWLTLLARLCGAFIGGDAEVELSGGAGATRGEPGSPLAATPSGPEARAAERQLASGAAVAPVSFAAPPARGVAATPPSSAGAPGAVPPPPTRFASPPAPGLPELNAPPPPLPAAPGSAARAAPVAIPLSPPAPPEAGGTACPSPLPGASGSRHDVESQGAAPQDDASAALPGPHAPAGAVATAPTAAPRASAGAPSSLPPLIDAQTHAEMARVRYEEDPQAGIEALEALCESYAPEPVILVALAELSARAGHHERAARVAREGIAACLGAGQTEAAARLLAAAGDGVRHVLPELEREETLALAGQLKPLGELRQSARVYAAVLREDRTEIRAIKGMLQIAEMLGRQPGEEEAASKIYRYVLDACPDSPLATFAEEGLSRLQHRGVGVE